MSDIEDANEAQGLALRFLIICLYCHLALLSDNNRPFLACLKIGNTVIMTTLGPICPAIIIECCE